MNNASDTSIKALCAEIITAKRRTFPSKFSILRSVASCRTLTFDHFSLLCPVLLLFSKKTTDTA